MKEDANQTTNGAPASEPDERGGGEGARSHGRSVKPALGDQLREGGSELLASGKQRLAQRIGVYESVVLDVSSKLRTDDHSMLAGQLESAADSVGNVKQYIDERSPEALLEDAGDLCRKHPAICFAGAFLAGLAGARFFKATTPQVESDGKDVDGHD